MANSLAQSPFDRVKELAEGNWDTIIDHLYPELSRATSRPGISRCACPVHASNKGARADGFRVFHDFAKTGGGVCNTCGTFPTGIDLICFLDGQENNPKHALHVLEGYFGLRQDGHVKRGPPLPREKKPVYDEREDPKAIQKRHKLLKEIWENSVPLSSLPDDHFAIRYLTETRGADDLDLIKRQENIRFNGDLYHSRVELEDHPPLKFPGLVSMFQSVDGREVGLHRIYLGHGVPRKAPVEKNKKVLKRIEEVLNGAVRIQGRAPFTAHANVCEGIETGIAIAYATGHPVYAAGFTSLMSSWIPPEGTQYVTIWADRDYNEAGITHALKLKARLQDDGIMCRILVPSFFDEDAEDWNDVLLHAGFEAVSEAYSGTSEQTDTY